MNDDFDASALAADHQLGDQQVPEVVVGLAGGRASELVWRNELGGLTFRLDDRYVKWNPRSTGIDLARERVRLDWLCTRHRAPTVIAFGEDADAQWMMTTALAGSHAVGDVWRTRRTEAIRAIARGLRAIHAVPLAGFPDAWVGEVWMSSTPEALGPRPPVEELVLVHGDACAPNTLISEDGEWVGHVDLGDLGVGDRWADLAVASLSLDWNFGEGHQDELFDAYGIERDDVKIRYYRELWHLES